MNSIASSLNNSYTNQLQHLDLFHICAELLCLPKPIPTSRLQFSVRHLPKPFALREGADRLCSSVTTFKPWYRLREDPLSSVFLLG